MACRVGMTTDLDERRAHWASQHPTMRNWQILHKVYTKREALDWEKKHAELRGCESGQGGGGPDNGVWYVYYFEY